MAIIISKAILHVVDNTKMDLNISNEELDFESETCYEFITKHVRRLSKSPNCQTGVFNKESEVLTYIQQFKDTQIYFKELTTLLVTKLSEIMFAHVDIPPSDVLFVKFTEDDVEHLAIIKLNYNDCFVRQRSVDDKGNVDNQIIKFNNVLPLNAAKVEEACIIPFDEMVIRLLEKPHLADGDACLYFSTLFLDCNTNISKRETVDIIDDVNNSINLKYFDDNLDNLVKISNAIIEEAEDSEGFVRMENVATKAFGADSEIKDEYIKLIRECGIIEDVDLGEKFVRKEFGTQKFTADNGIEVKFPTELVDDDDTVVIKHNADGSVNITLNHLFKKTPQT